VFLRSADHQRATSRVSSRRRITPISRRHESVSIPGGPRQLTNRGEAPGPGEVGFHDQDGRERARPWTRGGGEPGRTLQGDIPVVSGNTGTDTGAKSRPPDRFGVRETDGRIELEVPADFSTPRPSAW